MSDLEATKTAFANAAVMIHKLKELGVAQPRVELYSDASGRVYLGAKKDLEKVSAGQVFEVIGSRRVSFSSTEAEVSVDFCRVLYQEEQKEGEGEEA